MYKNAKATKLNMTRFKQNLLSSSTITEEEGKRTHTWTRKVPFKMRPFKILEFSSV